MQDIYKSFNLPLTDEAVTRAQAYCAANTQHKLGKPVKVRLEEVGLSEDRVREDFKEYLAELVADDVKSSALCCGGKI